jgi:hypothetical protein
MQSSHTTALHIINRTGAEIVLDSAFSDSKLNIEDIQHRIQNGSRSRSVPAE